jgi:hypothetical protein
MSLEGLYVPTSAPWYAEFKSELLGFPAAKHDDQVDALGLIGKLLDQMVVGQKPKGAREAKTRNGLPQMETACVTFRGGVLGIARPPP